MEIKQMVDVFFSRLAGWAALFNFLFFGVLTFMRIMAPFRDPVLVLGQGISLFFAFTATIFFFFQQWGTCCCVPKETAKKIRVWVIASLYLLLFFGLAAMYFTDSLWAFWITVVDTIMLYLFIFLVAFLAGATEGQPNT